MPRLIVLLLALLGLSSVSIAHDMSTHWQALHKKRGGLAVSLAADAQGRLWRVEARAGQLWVSQSNDTGVSFSPPVPVNATPETIQADGQNRPQIALIERAGATPVIAVAWAQALNKVFSGRVRFSRSTDGGRSFEAPRTLNDDGNDALGHSFVAMDATGARLALAWIDGRAAHAARKLAGGKKSAYAGSAIYVARSDDAGASFTANRKLADHSCECCRLALAHTPEGTPLLLWRHLFAGDVRDFALADFATGQIARASHDGWAINACPHHGGALAVAAEGTRHWAWFTGAPDNPGLFYRTQKDGVMSAPQPFGNPDAQAGHPALWASANGRQVHRAWREFSDGRYALRSQRSQDGGTSWEAAHTLATSTGAADLPMFVRSASVPLLAWNSADEGLRIVRMALERAP